MSNKTPSTAFMVVEPGSTAKAVIPGQLTTLLFILAVVFTVAGIVNIPVNPLPVNALAAIFLTFAGNLNDLREVLFVKTAGIVPPGFAVAPAEAPDKSRFAITDIVPNGCKIRCCTNRYRDRL